jgi:hypothetical protein
VHRRVGAPAGVDPVDEALEGGFFLVAGVGPPVAEDQLAVAVVGDAEEVFECTVERLTHSGPDSGGRLLIRNRDTCRLQ